MTPENKKAVRSNAIDVVFVLGVALVVYGLGLAWRPLWFISGGAALAAVAFIVGGRA